MLKLQKKNIRSYMVLCSTAIIIVIGSTIAFFSSTDEITNKFVGSRFDITLTETNWDPKKALSVMPGDELDKNPRVTNNERTDAYVFLRVTVPGYEMMVDEIDGSAKHSTKTAVPLYKFMRKIGNEYKANETYSPVQEVNSPWKLITAAPSYNSEKKQYVYVYAYCADVNNLLPLKKGETTIALFDKLQLWNFNEDFDPVGDQLQQNVRVEALGIQTNLPGLTSSNITEIWNIVSGEGG